MYVSGKTNSWWYYATLPSVLVVSFLTSHERSIQHIGTKGAHHGRYSTTVKGSTAFESVELSKCLEVREKEVARRVRKREPRDKRKIQETKRASWKVSAEYGECTRQLKN